MTATVTSGVFSVRGLFAGRRFGLTYYQREYAWSRADVKALLTDLRREFDRDETSYYLGAIVFYREDDVSYLIDGQQRVTTLNLLLLHLRQLLRDQGRLTSDVDALILPGPDRPSFALDVAGQAYLYESIRDGEVPAPRDGALDSEHQVAQRYVELAEDFPVELTGEWLEPFTLWLLDHVFVVGIEAVDREHGWRIFETTNDRGVRLGPLDLLKGFLLVNSAGGKDDADVEALNQDWRSMVAALSAVHSRAPSDFLKRYLTARYADLADPEDLSFVEDAFHEWIHRDPARLGLSEPSDYARLIRDELVPMGGRYAMLARAATRWDPAWAPVFYNEHNQIPHHLTAILACTSEVDSFESFAAKALLVARFLDVLFVRRLVHEKIRDAADLAPAVLELVSELRETDEEASVRALLAARLAAMGDPLPGPARFGLTESNVVQVRYLLARLSSYVETAVGRPDRFVDYAAASPPYVITHIWGENFGELTDVGVKSTFAARRQRLAGLVLFPSALRFSDQSPYASKLDRYRGQHLLAALLHPDVHADPTVSSWIASVGLQEELQPVPKAFTQQDMVNREYVVGRLMELVWGPAAVGLGSPEAPGTIASLAAAARAAASPTTGSPAAAPAPRPREAKAVKKAAKKAPAAPKKQVKKIGPSQAVTVRQLIATGHLAVGDRLLGYTPQGKPTGHTATLAENGRVVLPDGREAIDLDGAGRAAQNGRACNGWTFWWVDRRDGPIPIEAVRQGASNVGDI